MLKKLSIQKQAAKLFTEEHLQKLRDAYGKLGNTIDPEGASVNKLREYLRELPDPLIEQIAHAKIKFMSSMALAIMTQRQVANG